MDESAIIVPPSASLAGVSTLAEEFSKATRLTRYQEGLRDETLRRQRTDLLTFAPFLASVGLQPGDFYNDLDACRAVPAAPLERIIHGAQPPSYPLRLTPCRLPSPP